MKKQKDQEITDQEVAPKEKDENPAGFQVVVREFKKDRLARFSLYGVCGFTLFVVIASFFINMDALNTVDILSKYDPPSFDSVWDILGRDAGGRSILGLLIVGSRNSLIVGISITFITTAVGLLVGLCMGYYGGNVDKFGMRVVDFIGILPTLLIIIAFVTIVPEYNVATFVFIMSAFYWIGTARLVRSKALSEARRDYVSASKTMGTSSLRIMFKSVLPNISSIIIVNAILSLAGNVGIETSLSYLGFGLPPATPSLGTLISYASMPEVMQYKPYVWLPATLVILLLMLGINYAGRAFKRASDAKQRLG